MSDYATMVLVFEYGIPAIAVCVIAYLMSRK